MSESEFQKYVLQVFENDPDIMLWRRNVGHFKIEDKRHVQFGKPGQSDIEGIIKEYPCPTCGRKCEGVHVEMELKSTEGKPTDLQIEWLKKVSNFNGVAVVLYPIETDPIGLRDRIVKLLYQRCPKCCEAGSSVKKTPLEDVPELKGKGNFKEI